MSDIPPRQDPFSGQDQGLAYGSSQGKPAAMIAWGLYILSIPSANLLVLVGLVVAYAGRGSATGVARAHLDEQIRLFWSVFWWTIGLWIMVVISGIASIILIGIPFLLLALAALFILHVWFTIKAILALVNLLSDQLP